MSEKKKGKLNMCKDFGPRVNLKLCKINFCKKKSPVYTNTYIALGIVLLEM